MFPRLSGHSKPTRDISAYVSSRVYDGVRCMDPDSAARHRVRLRKAISKSQSAKEKQPMAAAD
jgi:hypothetical protein